MKNKVFAVPFLYDDRMKYAKKYLLDNGYKVDSIEKADFIILPIPVKAEHFDAVKANKNNAKVFYGFGDYNGFDYNKEQAFLLSNAYLTAEGAISLFKENSPKALLDSEILITGYGRIGKALHKLLNAYGADVSVCTRSPSGKAQAKYNKAKCIELYNLSDYHFDAIFNTVPKIIFSKGEIQSLDETTLYIELASFPGGIDKLTAGSMNIKLVDGKQLPLRYSPESAGCLIAKTVLSMIEEGLN